MKLSSLVDQDDFVLLAPGFRPDSSKWTLLRQAKLSSGDGAEPCVWLGRYETRGRDAMCLSGSLEEIDLDFDVEPTSLVWSLDETAFADQVERIRDAISAGDVYQVNLTRSAWVECASGARFLSALCRRGVPRFAAWFRLRGVWEVISASPEMLFELEGQRLRAEPMKGTAPAGQRAWLEASTKDEAELAMITDLLRDDLNHLCMPRSVQVLSARRYIELPYVVQAVSDVEGTLREKISVREVLDQLHPGGSITGAPREAARTMITSLEQGPRDFYCGFLGFQSAAHLRTALLIRTAQRTNGDQWRYGVGGGITWDSEANAELNEVRLKLGAL